MADHLSAKFRVNKDLRENDVVNNQLHKRLNDNDNDERPRFEIEPFESSLAPGISKPELEELLDEV